MELLDFINKYYIEGVVNDSSYNHLDMLTYVIVLFAGVYAVLKILNKLNIKVDEAFVAATIPYIFMGSVLRVIEDAEMLTPPIKYFFITPLIFFVVFAICLVALVSMRHLEKLGKIKNYIQKYSAIGIIVSLAGIAVLVLNSQRVQVDVLVYALLPAAALAGIVERLSPAIGMAYLRSKVYSFAIFSFLLDSFTTYIGGDMFGYTNKHPFSSFLTSVFGTGMVLVPLSLILVLLVTLMLEKESWNGKEDEKYMLILTLIVLGFSMGARNLLTILFGV